jgi:hypothetical protein
MQLVPAVIRLHLLTAALLLHALGAAASSPSSVCEDAAVCNAAQVSSSPSSFSSSSSSATVAASAEVVLRGPSPPSACAWAPTLHLSSNSRNRHPHGLCWVSTRRKFIYFNVAKVASTSLKQLTGAAHAARAVQSLCTVDPVDGRVTAFRPHKGRSEYSTEPEDAAGYFVFAFVRDPVARFLSGFHTVAKRGAAGGAYVDSKRMPFVRVVHDDRAQMAAFFGDADANGGPWEEHTAPQSFYLSHPQSRVPVAFDFVGRVESFERDWRELERRAGLAPAQGLPRRNSAEQVTAVPNTVTLQALRADAEMLRRVCELYAQDFACLNYSLPAACASSDGRTRASVNAGMAAGAAAAVADGSVAAGDGGGGGADDDDAADTSSVVPEGNR